MWRFLTALRPLPTGCSALALLLAAFLCAPQLAQAASFASPSTGLQQHLNALTGGANPQAATPASVSATELAALCQTLGFEFALSQVQAGQLQRAVANGDVSFGFDNITCDGTPYEIVEAVYVPGVITFSFAPARPNSGAMVTATATYSDTEGEDRSGHAWTITDEDGAAIADSEGAATGSGTTHTTSFTMPASGAVTINHTFSSDNFGGGATTSARSTTLAPFSIAPSVDAGADRSVLQGAMVTLSGVITRTGGAGMLSYRWRQVASDSITAALVATTASNYVGNLGSRRSIPSGGPTATFTAPQVMAATTYYFRLEGSDVAAGGSIRHTNRDVVAITITPVVAAAGGDQTVSSGASVTLDGSASTNAAGTTSGLTYAWIQTADATSDTALTSGANYVALSGANTATPGFTAPSSGVTLHFRLTVTETATMNTATDRVAVTVDLSAPEVNAGADRISAVGLQVTLSGSITHTGVGRFDRIIRYQWQQVARDSVTAPVVPAAATNYVGDLGGSSDSLLARRVVNAPASFTSPTVAQPTTYYFRLSARDITAASGTSHDVVAVTVNPAATVPTARAGADRSTAPGAAVALDGSASTNTAGMANSGLTYDWIQTADATSTTALVSGDSNYVSLSGAATATPSFTAPAATTALQLHFRLTVTETAATASDRVVVTVDPLAPEVNAGADQANVIEGSTVTLSGTVSTPTGTDFSGYLWQQVTADSVTAPLVGSGDPDYVGALPSGMTTVNSQPIITFTAPLVSATTTYYFRLEGTAVTAANILHLNYDVVAITVINTPTANAGPDQTRTFDTSVMLDGSASTNAAGMANSGLTYAWIQTADATSTTALASGDSNYVSLTGDSTAMPSFTFTPPASPATLHFLLRVTESGINATVTDRVTVAIGPTPLVSAGADQNVREGVTVRLSGTVTPRSGDTTSMLGYAWRQADASGTPLETPTVALHARIGVGGAPTGAPNGAVARSGDSANQTPAFFVAPEQSGGGSTTYYFRLRGHSVAAYNAYDRIAVTVRDSVSANAGPDQTIYSGSSGTLDGSASTNAAGVANSGLSYAWAQTGASASTHAATLTGSATAMPGFTFTTPDSETVLQFTLSVTETASGDTDSDTVAITIGPSPVVAAGADRTVREGAVVTLPGMVTPQSGDTTSTLVFVWRQVTADTGDAPGGTRVMAGEPGYVALSGEAGNVARSGATAHQARATFTAPELSSGAVTLYFRLRGVADSTFNAYDAIAITVQDSPAAAAGPDQHILAGRSVQLDGSGSTNANRASSGLAYAWVQTDASGADLNPPTITLDDANTATPSFTYTPPAAETVLHFRLTVTESRIGRSDSDTVAITVGPVPAVEAGADRAVGGGDMVTLSGTVTPASGYAGGVTFIWRQVVADSGRTAGVPVASNAPNAIALSQVSGMPAATFTAPAQSGGSSTTYYFRLRGNSAPYSAFDTVAITVQGGPGANAGPDQIIDTGTRIQLDGSASTNTAGAVNSGITYAWAQTDADGAVLQTPTVSFSSTSAANPSVTFTIPAAETLLHFLLTVTDTGNSRSGSDRVAITTGPAPLVNAGADQTVGRNVLVMLSGTVTPPGGSIRGYEYAWEQTDADGNVLAMPGVALAATTASGVVRSSGPARHQARTTFTAPDTAAVTTLYFRLTGATRYFSESIDPMTGRRTLLREYFTNDSVVITVDPTRAPSANAGADRTIGTSHSVTLDGSGSARASINTGGSIAYAWIQTEYANIDTALPSDNELYVGLSGANTAMPSFTYTPPPQPTALFFLLTVTDSMTMVRASDRVRITIGPVPVVRAGADQNVREGALVTLDGTVAGIAGSTLPLSYAWQQVTDAAGATILATDADAYIALADASGTPGGGRGQARATFTAPDVSADTALHFRLHGAANSSFFARDVVTITVSDRAAGVPTANAGADQTRTFGTSVTLDGSASANAAGVVNSGITYAWAQTDAAGVVLTTPSVTLSDATAAMPTFTFTTPAMEMLLHFRLTVTDTATSMTDSDRMSVLLGPTPMVNAGADRTAREGALVTLMGMVTPLGSGGGSHYYAWVQADASGAPLATPTITLGGASGAVNNNIARATFTAPAQSGGGSTTYYFRLRGHLAFQFNAYDSIAITVEDTPPAANRPTANAGADQHIEIGHSVTLDGSGSAPASANTGGSISYAWIQTADATSTGALVSGEANYFALTGATTAAPTFTFTAAGSVRVLHFRLGVTDGMTGVTEFDRVAITIGTPPAVNAGSDQTVDEGDTVTLAGMVTAPSGYSGAPLTYDWRQVAADSGAGQGVPVGGIAITPVPGAPSATFTAPEQGAGASTTYYFRLRGNAGIYRAFDTVAITVQNKVSAHAGPDQTRTEGATITLDGSASTNAAGANSGITYAWIQTADASATTPLGNGAVMLSDASAASPTFDFTPPASPTTLHFRLTVTETATMLTDSDRVQVTIGPTPAVNAGSDQTVDEGDTVTLSGTVTAVAGSTTTVQYAWQQTNAAGVRLATNTITFTGASSGSGATATAAFTAPEQSAGDGMYYFRLRGHANFAYNAYDSVVITVRDTDNRPTANAGAAVTRTEGTTVTLDGSASTNAAGANSGITYDWIQTADDSATTAIGSGAVTLSDASAASPTFTFTPPASPTTLHFRLTVTETATMRDDSDRVQVTIGPTPAVNAGGNQAVDEGATVTLSGTVTAVPGSTAAVQYVWQQTDSAGVRLATNTITFSGASRGTPGAGGAATASFTAPEQTGSSTIYYFRLRGHAAFAYNAFDSVAITVRETSTGATPTANAGAEQFRSEGPTITLDGSASTNAAGANSGLTYAWIQTASASATMPLGSGAVTLSDASAARPSFTITPTAAATLLFFRLTVTDTTTMVSDSDRVRVTIGPTPMVNAGADQTSVLEGQQATLRGMVTPHSGDTASALGYGWQQVTADSGNSATATLVQSGAPNYIALTGASGSVARSGANVHRAHATFTAPPLSVASATYYFRLRGDAELTPFVYSGFDAVVITVNKPPTADAGSDRTFLTGVAASLNGSASASALGAVNSGIAYAWEETDADGAALTTPSVTLAGATSATPSFTAPSSAGTLHFRLTVTDNANSATATDSVTITITADRSPQTSAGADQTVSEGAAVTLSGNVRRTGGDTTSTLSYAWAQITSATDPTPVMGGITLSGASGTPGAGGSATASFTAPDISATSTTYYFQLTGAANTAHTATDITAVTVNGKPTANAGSDRRNIAIAASVTLDGSASRNAAGGSGGLSYLWIQTASATSSTALSADDAGYLVLRDAAQASATFTAPNARRGVTLHFLLTVTDTANMETASDRVRIAVGLLPRVSAGGAQTVRAGAAVTLNGAIMPAAGTSADSFTYSWGQFTAAAGGARVQPGDDGYALLSPMRGDGGTATATFTAPTPAAATAIYYFRLTGTATVGAASYEATDVAAVTVNRPPTANAGGDITRITSSTSVRLDGSASSDGSGVADGNITYAWIQTADASATTAISNSSITLSGASSATPTITYTPPPAPVTLHFLLTVTDNANGESATDRVTVTIGPAPTVNAGTDQTVVEGATVTLDGMLTSVGGTSGGFSTADYRWLQVTADSGRSAGFTRVPPGDPGLVTLTSPRGAFVSASATTHNARASFTAPDINAASATYYFNLRGWVNTNYNAFDTIAITVHGRPAANAGTDQQVMSGASVSLSGSASADAAGNINSGIDYAWIQTADALSTDALGSGDSNYVALSGANTATPGFTAPSGAAILYFRLTVTGRANNRSASDRIIVSVGAVPAIAAGNAQTVREGAAVTLGGSVTRASGDTTSTLSYTWTQVAAPSISAARVMSGAAGYISLSNASGSVATSGANAGQARASFTAPDISATAAAYHFLLSGAATDTAMTVIAGVPQVVTITVQGAPSADAGPDQDRSITSSSRILLQLNASASTSASGRRSGITYRWIQTADATSSSALQSGDGNYVTISSTGPTSPLASFSFNPGGAVTLHFLLTVTDTANMQTASDRVAISFSLRPDVAAFNQTAIEGGTVTLRGTITRAVGDSSAISYEWRQITSPTDTSLPADAVTLSGATGNTATATASFTAPQISAARADYYFQLSGATAAGSHSAIISVTVRGRPSANAGPDRQVAPGSGATVTLDGSASASASGQVNSGITYAWAQTGADGNALATPTVTLSGDQSAMATFTAPGSAALLHFALSVTDTANNVTATDRVQVTVGTPLGIAFNAPANPAEGGSIAYTGTLSGDFARTEAVTVGWAVSGAAVAAADFCDAGGAALSALPSGSETIATSASATAAITIRTCDDSLLEDAEEFSVTFTSNGNGLSGVVNTDSVTITDNDTASVRIVRTDSDGFAEGASGAAASAVFTVTISGATTTSAAAITFGVSGGTPGADYSVNPAAVGGIYTLNLGAGVAGGNITLTAADDNAVEGGETARVTLTGVATTGSANIASAPANFATATLADDEEATAGIVRATDSDGFAEGGSGAAGRTSFSVTLGGEYDQAVTLPFSVGGVGITASDYDISAPTGIAASATGGTVQIAAGSLSATITITASADTLLEGAETLSVTLGAPSIGGGLTAPTIASGAGSASAEIADANSASVTLSRDGNGALSEGQMAAFQIHVSGAQLSEALSVTISVSGSGITSGDYSAPASASVQPSGSATATGMFNVTALRDSTNEAMETMTVAISAPTTSGTASLGTPVAVDVNIAESDPVTFRIARSGGAAVSEGGTASFTVSRSTASGGVATLQFSIGGVSADDYDITAPGGLPAAATGGAVSFGAGELTQSIALSISDDALNEARETLTVRGGAISVPALAGPVAFASGGDTAEATISASDPISVVTLAAANASVEEGGNAAFTVTLGAASAADASVEFSASISSQSASTNTAGNSQANSGANPDFTLTTTSPLSIAAGETSGVINLAIAADRLAEAAETLQVAINRVTLAGNAGGSVTASFPVRESVTIPANSAATYAVNFASNAPGGIAEPASSGAEAVTNIPVTLNGPAGMFPGGGNIQVTWTFGPGETSAADFGGGANPAGGTLTFTATQRTQNIPITVAHDNLSEGGSDGDETFTLALAKASTLTPARETQLSGVQVAATARNVNITDADDIAVSIARTATTAIAENGGAATFRVTTTFTPTANLRVPYSIGGAGITSADITAAALTGTVTINAGDSDGQTFSITAADDALLEGAETIIVTLDASGYSGGGGVLPLRTSAVAGQSASAAITDDESATATLSGGGGSVSEGGEAVINIALSGATRTADVTVRYTIGADGDANTADAAAGDTSDPGGGSITIAPGANSGAITIRIADDNLNEPPEVFAVRAAVSSNGAITAVNATQLFTITDDDAVRVAIARDGSGAVEEGGALNFAITLSGGARGGGAVVVPFTLSGLEAAEFRINPGAGISGITASGATLQFGAENTRRVTLNLLDDDLNEAAKTLTLTGAPPGPSGLRGPGGGGEIIYAPGGNTASANILASDPVRFSIARSSGSGGVAEGAAVDFSITMNGAAGGSAGAVMLPWTARIESQANMGAANTIARPDLSASGIAPSGPGELRGTLAIPARTASGAITITAANDGFAENAERFVVTLGSPTAGPASGAVTVGAPDSVAVTINENAAALHVVRLRGPDAPLEEGGVARFTFDLPAVAAPNARSTSLTVAYTLGGSASGSDYTAPDGSVTFAASETSQVVEIAITDDALNEGAETLSVTLGAITNRASFDSIGSASASGIATATIRASDAATYSIANASDTTEPAPGGAAMMSFRVTLSAASVGAVTIPYTLGGSATGGGDYTNPSPLSVTLPAGDTRADIEIAILPDNVNEAAEAITIILGATPGVGAGGGVVTLSTASGANQGSGSIPANDPVTIRIARSDSGAVNEGGAAQFSVSLALTGDGATAATSASPICVTFTTAVRQSTTLAAGASANTAQNPDIAVRDCSGAPVTSVSATGAATGGVTIPAGQSSATFAITARFDNEDEGSANETLTVTLSGATHTGLTGAATLTADSTAATAPIANVNALRTLAVSAASVTGGEDEATAADATEFAEFTAGITGMALTEPVMVAWTLVVGDDGANLPGAAASGLARNHGGDHQPDFGAAMIRESGGGTVNADGISGTLLFPVGAPTARTVRVPVLQDALNEGAEGLTLRLTDPCPARPAICSQGGGGGGSTPALQLTTREQRAEVPASDPIVLSVRRTGDGTVVSGGSITFVASFGTTTVNGVETPIAPSRPITITLPLMGADDPNQMVTLTAAAGDTTATHPPIAKDDIAARGTPMIMVGTPSITVTGTTDAPPGGADIPAPTDTARLPAPVQTATWSLARTLPGGAEAPEGADYRVEFRLEGSATPTALSFTWRVAGSPGTGGGAAAVVGDFNCGSAATPRACTSADGFPSGTVRFAAGDSIQTITIAIFDDGQDEGIQPGGGAALPEGFTLTLDALGGANAGDVEFADTDSQLPGTLQVDIPALRADLRVADAVAAEGADAVFALTLANFTGGTATTLPVTVTYTLGVDDDSATRGADYTAGAATATAEIAAGAASAVIAIPLVQDGVLESRETFTLTITDATGGGGSIRLVNAAGEEQQQISATGTITDDADQSARRKQRVGALVSVLDRQTAIMATDAITARLERNRADASAQLSIANRNLLGGGGAAGAQSADDSGIGLALYGAAGLGGATAGLPGGGGGGGTSGAGGNYIGGASGSGGGAFAGLGAGLAGGANMGSQTALPSLAELINGSRFAFQVSWWPPDIELPDLSTLAEGVQIWGSGGFANLKGNPQNSRASLDYDGDNLAFFIGADTPLHHNLLAGFALGWASGDLNFTDRAGSFTMNGSLSNDVLSLHPYIGWQITPNLNAWLMLGFGFGSVDISESEGSGASRISRNLNGGDSSLLMLSTGFAGQRRLAGATDLKLRFEITRVSSKVQAARFDDGAWLPGTKARSARIGGELELGRRYTLASGLSLRPFGTLGLRLDNSSAAAAGGARSIYGALDWGGGVAANWPALGLDGRAEFSLQLNKTGHKEQRIAVDLNFDPGADSQGLTLALQTALSEQRGGLPNAASGRSGLGSTLAVAGGASQMQRSLSGELGYGVALRQFGRAALLTPYGRFDLGSTDQRWAAGLRLAESGAGGGGGLQLGIEAGLDLESTPANSAATAPARSYDLLLTGRLRF